LLKGFIQRVAIVIVDFNVERASTMPLLRPMIMEALDPNS